MLLSAGPPQILHKELWGRYLILCLSVVEMREHTRDLPSPEIPNPQLLLSRTGGRRTLFSSYSLGLCCWECAPHTRTIWSSERWLEMPSPTADLRNRICILTRSQAIPGPCFPEISAILLFYELPLFRHYPRIIYWASTTHVPGTMLNAGNRQRVRSIQLLPVELAASLAQVSQPCLLIRINCDNLQRKGKCLKNPPRQTYTHVHSETLGVGP